MGRDRLGRLISCILQTEQGHRQAPDVAIAYLTTDTTNQSLLQQ
jgi:hypothetical protein